MFRSKSKKGFTLIELLVVISIIAILASIGLVAYSNAGKKGRDARRRADMKALQGAFEQHYSIGEAGVNSVYGTCVAMGDLYISGKYDSLKDPKTKVAYDCTSADTLTYCACAKLEEVGAGNSTTAACAFGAGDYFCVKNLQ